MRIDRRATASAVSLLAFSTLFALVPWVRPAAAASKAVPPFCVLKGGARGMPLPQICRFFDYQQCLQAAADLNGNCVVNIDYHGDVSTLPPPGRSRHRIR